MKTEREKFIEKELRESAKRFLDWAKEDRAESREDSDRRDICLAKAEAYEYFAKECRRILTGKTSVEAMAERLAPHFNRKEG